MAQVFKTPQARFDGVDIADYIAQHSVDSALRFLEQLEETLTTLVRNPEFGQLCHFKSPTTLGMRVWQVKGFPNHLIFYRALDAGIEVVRVLHGARDLDAIFGP